MKNDINIANRSESSTRIPNLSMRPISERAFRPRCISGKRPSPFSLSSTFNSNSNLNLNYQLAPNNSSHHSNISSAKKVNHIIEREKLHEQVMQYKIVVNQLQRELNSLKGELKEKDSQLSSKDRKITEMLQQIESPLDTDKSQDFDIAGSNANLLSKIRKECRKIDIELQEEYKINDELKKNKKLTKMNESMIELQILNDQTEQIKQLLNNSMNKRNSQLKEIAEYEKYEETLDSQGFIINSLQASLEDEIQREKELNIEKRALQNKIEEDNKIIENITKENMILLKNNDVIQQEKMKEIGSINKKCHMIISDTSAHYAKTISDLERQVFQYKQEVKKSDQKLNQLQQVKNAFLKRQSQSNQQIADSGTTLKDSIIYGQNDKQIADNIVKSQEIENEISRLREVLKSHKEKEEEYARIIYEYEEKIKNYDQGMTQSRVGIGIKNDNPFYSDDPNNDPLRTQKFTNEQYNQFIFVLFKNFESKGITQEIAKEKILDALIPNNDNKQQEVDSIKELMGNFANKTIDLLNCDYEPDRIRLEILFGALCYHCNSDSNSIFEYFLSLFSYINFYSKDKEDKIKQRIKKKYNAIFNQLKLKVRELNIKREYISLLQLKDLIDQSVKGIKDKYVEFLFYLMKKFNDKSASLFDLKVSVLYELDTELDSDIDNNDNQGKAEKIGIEKERNINLNEDNLNEDNLNEDNLNEENLNEDNLNEENLNESVQEITSEEYERLINNCLRQMKEYLIQSNMSLRQLLTNSIITIDDPSPCQVIIIESLNDELSKVNIEFSDLQLSCLCAKYTVNNQLQALSIEQLENDLQSIDLAQLMANSIAQ